MSKKHFHFIFLLLFFLPFSCTRQEKIIHRSFYYWRSAFSLSSSEEKLLDSLKIEKLYVKFFDVTWSSNDKEAKPVAIISFKDHVPEKINTVPVIYITNETLMGIKDTAVDRLAAHIYSLVNSIASSENIVLQEIQFDCDWTDKTREKYFHLLTVFKKTNKVRPLLISATIRLHQIKYAARTGIPPVDRGMLMFYNMGKLEDPKTKNSIFDPATAELYTEKIKDYPLPLDAALPIFTWGVRLREGRVIGLMNNVPRSQLDTVIYFKRISDNYFDADTSFFYRGNYFMKHDQVRIEQVDPALCLHAAEILAAKLKSLNFTVVLFHFDESNISRYAQQDLENIYSAFH